MEIQQFYDKSLSHASYVILSQSEAAVVDPGRNPQQYYDFASDHNAEIVYVLETHPHADFVSSHLQIHNETNAEILINELADPEYPYQSFNHNDEIAVGAVTIKALHTPGHSPDSNSYLVTDPETSEQVLFTGDFLFIGDVGRPDLREKAGNTRAVRKELAEKMYDSVTTVLPPLADDVVIYPAHGAGSLCGKKLSKKLSDTLGSQRKNNWALQEGISKEDFISTLLRGQPFIPKYFSHCVEVNSRGAANFDENITNKYLSFEDLSEQGDALVIDTRDSDAFRSGSHEKALNIPAGHSDKFETWLGSIVAPDEEFTLIVDSEESAQKIHARIHKIGYEKNIKGYYKADDKLTAKNVLLVESDITNPEEYLILDVRQENEHREEKAFEEAENIPLSVLRESVEKLPTDRPIVAHCAGGYRSAIAASVIAAAYPNLTVQDIGTRIKRRLS